MQEIWKPVKGHEKYFEISNLGRLKRILVIDVNMYHKPSERKVERIVKTKLDRGYEKIALSINGKRKIKYIHRLVAETFIPNPNNYKEVNHKDNNPSNNRVDNLEWCDRKYNLDYMRTHQEEIKERHEMRIEALETIKYLASLSKTIDSEKINELIPDYLLGDY